MTVREEVLRQLVERAFEHPPLWLSIGVARYVAAATSSTQARGGYPLAEDLVVLRAPWLPVRSIFSATQESPEWREPRLRRRLVAQAALYVAFWRSLHPDGDLSRIVLDRTRRGPEQALTDTLGLDLDEFGTKAERYFREGKIQRVRLTADVEASGCVRASDQQEGAALRIHGLINQGHLEDARDTLTDASQQLAEASPVLRVAGARLRAAEGRRSEAIAEFTRLERSGTTSSEWRRFFAEALVEGVPGGAPGSASDFEKAEELLRDEPDDAPADVYGLRARAELARGDGASAALDALEAFARWPRHEFALLAAEAYAKSGNEAVAADMLRALAEAGESTNVRASAARALANLSTAGAGTRKLLPVWRRPLHGDRTTTGRFVGVECGATWTVLRVSTGGRDRLYATVRLELLDIRNYRPVAVQPVRCDARLQPEDVRVTWRHEENTPPASEGIAVALEFLP